MGDKLEFVAAVLAEVETIVESDSTDEMDAALQEIEQRVKQAGRYVRELQAECRHGEGTP